MSNYGNNGTKAAMYNYANALIKAKVTLDNAQAQLDEMEKNIRRQRRIEIIVKAVAVFLGVMTGLFVQGIL